MRSYAHQLENQSDLRFKRDILMLRRHEKDYFLRQDFNYVKKLNRLIQDLKVRLDSINTRASLANKELLEKYEEAFNDIVTLEKEIGVNSTDGLRLEMNYYSAWMKNTLTSVVKSVETANNQKHEATLQFIAIFVLAGIVSFVVLIIYLSKSISRPVVAITQKMRAFDMEKANLIMPSDFKRKDLTSEMVIMMKAYNKMVDQIKSQVTQIEDQRGKLSEQNTNLKQLNDELDRFAFSVSHDLRSPITSILGLINLVKIENPDLIEITYLHHMEECVEKLNKFIENLLFYSKNAKDQLEVEPVMLSQVVNSFKSTHLTDRIPNLSIKMLNDDQPIFTDHFRLDIILNNLLSNAVKYRDPHKPNCNITIYQSKSLDESRITITDNGIGISEQDLSRVFELFYRSKVSEDGTGLGLYLVKKTIKKIEGHIEIDSKEGIGTKVTLYIPDLPFTETQLTSNLSLSEI